MAAVDEAERKDVDDHLLYTHVFSGDVPGLAGFVLFSCEA